MITELSDQRYSEIDRLVSNEAVLELINAVDKIEIELIKHNIEAKETYQYLLTTILTNC
jgi:hypothetical protein